jgi:hypothetical protein
VVASHKAQTAPTSKAQWVNSCLQLVEVAISILCSLLPLTPTQSTPDHIVPTERITLKIVLNMQNFDDQPSASAELIQYA